ncbi:MAG TPA: energy transducer TonB [Mucilaginibacter sp.]|jgi:hypothetical protein|nr:energy transducer TonB [Mucilaginibacter sp.]
MEKLIKNIKLEFSCPANWDEMGYVDGARFCTHCNQKVFDFTNSKAQDFLAILAENGNNVCGRYTAAQLTPVYPARSNWKKWLSAAVIFLGINIWSNKAKAQLDAVYPLTKEQAIVDTELYMGKSILAGTSDRSNIDKEAEFPGGEKALNDFVKRNVDKTKKLKDGWICISFTIDPSGHLSNFYFKKSIGADNDQEALRILRLMPKWKPAVSNGKPVSTNYSLPFRFEL